MIGDVLSIAAGATRRGRRRSTVTVVAVVTLACTGIVAGAAVAGSAADRLDAAFRAGHGADAVLTVDADQAAAANEIVRSDPAVASVAGPRGARLVEMRHGAESLEHLVSVPSGAGIVGSPTVVTGRMPTAGDEVALDAAVGRDLGITVGGRVDLDGRQFRVSALAFDLADCFHPSCDPARSWVTAEGLARVGGAELAVLDVDLTDTGSVPVFESRLGNALGDDAFGVNTWTDTRADLLAESELFGVFLGAFGVLVLIASAVVLATLVGGRVAARRRVLGLYRAAGATPGQMGAAILVEHVVIAGAAAVAGWLIAGLLAPRLAVGAARVLGSGGSTFRPGDLLLAITAAVVVTAAAVAVPAWRAGRLTTAMALRDVPRGTRRTRVLAALAGRLGPAAELGARSWVARPGRAIGTSAAIAIAVVAGVTALSIDRGMARLLAEPQLLGDPGDAVVVPEGGLSPGGVAATLDSMPEVRSWFTVEDTRATLAGGEGLHLRVLGGDLHSAGFVVGDGRMPRASDEIVVGYVLLAEEGWAVDDVVELAVDGAARPFRITGWYRETEDGGRVVQAWTSAASADAGYVVHAASAVTPERLLAALDPLGQVEPIDADGAELDAVRVAMAALSALLAAIAVAHVLTTALNVAGERTRERSLLIASGCTRAQLARAAGATASLSLLVAVVVGLPVGWLLQSIIGTAIMSSVGVGPGIGSGPPVGSVALLVVTVSTAVVAVEVVASAPTSRQKVNAGWRTS